VIRLFFSNGVDKETAKTMINTGTKVLMTTFIFFLLCAGICMAQDATTVMLAGTGPTPGFQAVMDGISDTLSSNGIKVKIASGEAKPRTVVLDEMKTSGNTVLLYVTLNQDPGGRLRPKIVAESYVDGKKVWEEEARGGVLRKAPEKFIQEMLKDLDPKLVKHIGGPGLPKQ
jgi:hypothetical protein